MGQKLSKWKTQAFPRGLNCSLARENSYIAGESSIGRLTLPFQITMMKENYFLHLTFVWTSGKIHSVEYNLEIAECSRFKHRERTERSIRKSQD